MHYALFALLLAGCATPEMAKYLNPAGLCTNYGEAMRANDVNSVIAYAAEMRARSITQPPSEEFDAIRGERVSIGMSECGMFAAWGMPTISNNTHTVAGTGTQHVYRGVRGRYISTRSNYAYTQNGRVVAVQN